MNNNGFNCLCYFGGQNNCGCKKQISGCCCANLNQTNSCGSNNTNTCGCCSGYSNYNYSNNEYSQMGCGRY